MAKEYFQKHNIGYNEIDVAADPKKAQEMVEKTGHFGVPVIDIDGQIIFGFNQAQIEKALGYKK
jgi:glutaredoxin